ncbi:MAG: hypothetical protein LBM18_02385 [Oscillospiraceae bacterium]|nr:hypothetical protein [Oscillospiraceae bacterium]
MIDMLPEKEQNFALELMKKLVLAWDPDFTKLTPAEAERLRIGKRQFAAGESYSDSEIDWDNLDNMDLG